MLSAAAFQAIGFELAPIHGLRRVELLGAFAVSVTIETPEIELGFGGPDRTGPYRALSVSVRSAHGCRPDKS